MNKVVLALAGVVVLGAAGGAFWVKKQRDDYEKWRFAKIEMSENIARLPANWSAQTLASRLEKSKKVRESGAFEEAAQEIGLQTIAAGAYALPQTASPRDLAQIFKAGPTHASVTFPEGFTGLQMARRLARNGFAGAKDFENRVYPAQGASPHEGFLFPSTYFLPLKASGRDLIGTLNDEWRERTRELRGPFPSVKGRPISLRELTIIASLVEREAVSAAEMPLVARVILNRLNEPMRLQIDATIQYARVLEGSGHTPRLLYADLKIDSPFNSYKNDGLPPTPICNPGMDALRAAAKPAKSDALFYVFSPKLKRHRFSRGYDEFLKNKRLAKNEREALSGAS